MKIIFAFLVVILIGASSSALAGCPVGLDPNYMLSYMNINNNTDNLDVKAFKGNINGSGYKSIKLKPKTVTVDHNSSEQDQSIIDSVWCKNAPTPTADLYIKFVDKKNASNEICHVVVTLTGGTIANSTDVKAYPQTETISCTAERVEDLVHFTVTLGKN